jgi:long-chain-fatty-acid--CoA ligase ACSBG
MFVLVRSDQTSRSFRIARLLVLNKIKSALGFKRCRMFVTAAAPLSSDIKKYFMSLDMPIMDVFGMSEVGGAHTLSVLSAYSILCL